MGAAQFRAAGLNLDLQLGQKSNCSEFRTLEMLIVSLLLCLLSSDPTCRAVFLVWWRCERVLIRALQSSVSWSNQVFVGSRQTAAAHERHTHKSS